MLSISGFDRYCRKSPAWGTRGVIGRIPFQNVPALGFWILNSASIGMTFYRERPEFTAPDFFDSIDPFETLAAHKKVSVIRAWLARRSPDVDVHRVFGDAVRGGFASRAGRPGPLQDNVMPGVDGEHLVVHPAIARRVA